MYNPDEFRYRFLNYYECPKCGEAWCEPWECTCDDDCPNCGMRHISPYYSEDIPRQRKGAK